MNRLLLIVLSILLTLPFTVTAEVYKWKDKDGVTRYSDTPPPSNVQQLPVSGKKAPAAATNPTTTPTAAPTASNPDVKKPTAVSSEGEAIKRQQKAEAEKKLAEQKEAELQANQHNCKAARANMQNYQQGGRISKFNEKGEREYLGEAAIAQGLEQSKLDIEKYCGVD